MSTGISIDMEKIRIICNGLIKSITNGLLTLSILILF